MWFFNRHKPSLSDICYEHPTWELHEDQKDLKSWLSGDPGGACFRLLRGKPSWTFDLRSPDSCQRFFEHQARDQGGSLVDCIVDELCGHECLTAIFKYPSPFEDHLGINYIGIVWLPFDTCIYQFNFEALEHGTTGLREAAVIGPSAAAEPALPVTRSEGVSEAIYQSSTPEEIFNTLNKNSIRRLASDDSEYDELFPDHPLSKVRQHIDSFKAGVSIHSSLANKKPYRCIPK